MFELPFSPACERNKEPLAEKLRPLLKDSHTVLEFGSGTGQHAEYFAPLLPHLSWQTSDIKENLEFIGQRTQSVSNCLSPIEVDVFADWHSPLEKKYDAFFTANTFHIIAEKGVEKLIGDSAQVAAENALFLIYGPFKYAGKYTSESNREFEGWLKSESPERGIRDFEKIEETFASAGWRHSADFSMPANNQLLVFCR